MRARLPSRASGRSLVLLLPTLIAITAVAAACGGSTRSASVSTTTTTVAGRNRSSTAAAARAKFASCLEAHGVPASQATQGFGFRRSVSSTTPGSGPGGSGSAPAAPAASTPPTTSAAYAAAFQACRSDLPARPAGGGFQNSAAGRAYLQCLQLHGVTLPSTPPTSNASGSATAPGGSATGPGGGFRSMTSDPAFQAARAACAPLAPNRAGDAGTTSTTAAA